MRTPTLIDEAFAWWRSALAGGRPPIHTEPHCGFYKRKLVRGGPHVPARIWLHQEIDSATGELTAPEEMRCEVGGKRRDAEAEWLYLCYLPITEAEFSYLTANADWARKYAPQEPAANPDRATDFNTMPLNF